MRRLTQAVCTGLLLSAASCQSDREESSLAPVSTTATEIENFVQEEAYPGLTGTFESVTVNGKAVVAMRVDDEYVLEGDMLLPKKAINRDGRTEAVGVMGRRWPKGVVYYRIAPDMPRINRMRISKAIKYWNDNTNVRLEWRTNQPNYVLFQRGEGCAADVGMIGGQQVIELSIDCSFGNTLHEIGHCVGLFHEHTRLNRDKYVRINFENIEEGAENNFIRADIRTSDVKDWAGQIDFRSIMMYPATAFSKNGEPTIARKDGKGYAAQREKLTSVDIMGVNYMYKNK